MIKKIKSLFKKSQNKKQPKIQDIQAYINSKTITEKQKKEIDRAVKKVVKDYGKTLKMLEFN